MNRFERSIASVLGIGIVAAALALAGSHAAQQSAAVPQGEWPEISDRTGELAAAGLAQIGDDGQLHVDAPATLQLLGQLHVDDRGTVLRYDRDLFGPSWSDVDHNGCDTRNDVLQRDLVDVEIKAGTHGCVVLTGTLHDPYTGTTIDFQRGTGTSAKVAIDHLWSLAAAWHHGAAGWTPEQRLAFANDPVNLVAVDGTANRSKSSTGPSGWLPDNTASWCEFAALYTFVGAKYSLSIGADDKSAIETTLHSCTN